MTLLLSASLVNCFLIITFSLTGLLRWENFTSTLGFYFSHKISYEVAWFTVASFRRTPICFSSEKHFKCEFKISDSLFHQTSPWRRSIRPGAPEIDDYPGGNPFRYDEAKLRVLRILHQLLNFVSIADYYLSLVINTRFCFSVPFLFQWSLPMSVWCISY